MDVRDRAVTTASPAGLGSSTMAALTVSWSAVWIGALSSVVAAVLFGFIGTAIGAHKAGIEGRVTSFSGVEFPALAFAVLSAFFAFALGGYIAARLAGVRIPEHAALIGAVVFVVGAFLMLALASQAAQYLNGWYSGLAPSPIGQPAVAGQPVDPNIAKAARNSASAAAVSLLVGLMGGAIGGWAGSGEPMILSRRATTTHRIATDRPY